MAPLSFYSQLETNLMRNRKVIKHLLQLKRAKAHGKNYIKVKQHRVRYFLPNRPFKRNPNPISPGRFTTNSTWGGEGRGGGAESALLRNFALLDPN